MAKYRVRFDLWNNEATITELRAKVKSHLEEGPLQALPKSVHLTRVNTPVRKEKVVSPANTMEADNV